jgi:hypothetical protein
MSFIFGTKNAAQPKQKSLGLNTVNTATNEQAIPLPYLAGKRRFAGTFISDAFDQHTSSLDSGGKDAGKGGGGSGTNYYCGYAIAFCLGPVDGFHDLWLNGEPVYTTNTPLVPQSLRQFTNVATFTTASAHNLVNGDMVIVTGADQPEFNGQFTVTVLNATQYTYVIPGTTIQSETATGQIRAWVVLDPIYRGVEEKVDITIPTYGILHHHWGGEGQTIDQYLRVSGTGHPTYRGVSYDVFERFFLGLNQTNVQNAEAVLSRIPTAAWLNDPAHANISDEANAAVVFYDLLTHPRSGLGLTVADFNLADLADVAEQLYDEDFGVSPLISRQETALGLVQQLLQTVDALPMLDANGLLSLVLVRAPADYNALTTLVDANLADIPKPNATGWSSVFTQTRIIFPNRAAAWNDDFVEWQDFAAQGNAQKLHNPQSLNFDWLTRRDLAQKLVNAFGPAAAIPAVTGKLTLLFTPALFAALSPGTVFQNNFTDATCARANGIFRVIKRRLPDSSRPVFEIEYKADRSYLNFAP